MTCKWERNRLSCYYHVNNSSLLQPSKHLLINTYFAPANFHQENQMIYVNIFRLIFHCITIKFALRISEIIVTMYVQSKQTRKPNNFKKHLGHEKTNVENVTFIAIYAIL